MSDHVLDLRDCTEYRTALLTRPPRTTRYLVGMIVVMLGCVLVWAAVSEIDVVVAAPAVVRPPDPPQEVRVALAGEVAEVSFREGDVVAVGEVLLRLRTNKIEQQIARIELDLGSTRQDAERRRAVKVAIEEANKHASAQAGTEVEVAELELERAEQRAQEANSKRELTRAAVQSAERAAERAQNLHAEQIVALSERERSEQALLEERGREEAAVAALHIAELDVSLARKRLETAELDRSTLAQTALLRIQEQDIDIAECDTKVALLEQDLLLARIDLEQSTIRAPISGTVVSAHPRPADLVVGGQSVARIAPSGLVITAQVPNFRIGEVRTGQAARIRLDAHDYQRHGVLQGAVIHVAPDASLIERSVGEPDSVYVVTIGLAPETLAGRDFSIGLGMTGIAEIVTTRERILKLVFRRVRQSTQT